MKEAAVKLRVKALYKSFPGVKALAGVNLAAKAGSVHAICGENGAGKSTLMQVIMGICKPDSGQILMDEKPVHIRNPIEARQVGISMVFQELSYVPEMTVEESFFMGRWPSGRLGKVNWKELRARAAEMLAQEHLAYSPRTKLKELSVAEIQILEIAKAISYNSEIIILDEPTSALTADEAERLFARIEELRRRGKSILYISHRLEEVFRLADDITVLRDGRVIDSRPRERYDPETLISQMVGRKLEKPEKPGAWEPGRWGDEALRVEGLSRQGRFQKASFYVRAGEIVGFAGVVGAGRTDVMRALFGLDPAERGEIRIKGQEVRVNSVADSLRHKMVMLSEDRRRYGLIPVRCVRENVSISSLRKFFSGGRLHAAQEKQSVEGICRAMNVRAASYETSSAALSGGNQQKVLLARWMLTDPDILLLDEPTRGIDVGAKQEIYKLMRSLAGQGKALVMVSSELPELIALCDRIYVMAQGRITGMLTQAEFTQESILAYATGAKAQEELSA